MISKSGRKNVSDNPFLHLRKFSMFLYELFCCIWCSLDSVLAKILTGNDGELLHAIAVANGDVLPDQAFNKPCDSFGIHIELKTQVPVMCADAEEFIGMIVQPEKSSWFG